MYLSWQGATYSLIFLSIFARCMDLCTYMDSHMTINLWDWCVMVWGSVCVSELCYHFSKLSTKSETNSYTIVIHIGVVWINSITIIIFTNSYTGKYTYLEWAATCIGWQRKGEVGKSVKSLGFFATGQTPYSWHEQPLETIEHNIKHY